MKAGAKLFYFIAGIIILIAGIYLIYLEFKQHNGGGHYRKWHTYPFIIAGAGAVCIAMPFFNDKTTGDNKSTRRDQNTGP